MLFGKKSNGCGGEEGAAPVTGMILGYGREKAEAAVADTYRLDGSYHCFYECI